MAKEKKQDGGWQFPKALEIVKCKEGNKEFMKERPARRPFGNTVLICEYPLGAKVSHNEKHWTSTVDNNVWEPGVYGWEEVESE